MTKKGGPPSREELRKFGLILGGLLALFAVLAFRRGKPIAPYYGAGAALSLLVSAARPEAMAAVFVPWMKVARVISRVNTFVILSVVYYVLLTPGAVIARLLGYDVLDERWGSEGSYWKAKPADEPAAVERQY